MSWVATRLSFCAETILVKLAKTKSTFYTHSFRKHPCRNPLPRNYPHLSKLRTAQRCTRVTHVSWASTRSRTQDRAVAEKRQEEKHHPGNGRSGGRKSIALGKGEAGLAGWCRREKGSEHRRGGSAAAPEAQIPNRTNSCFTSSSSVGSEADFMTYLFILSLMNRRLI